MTETINEDTPIEFWKTVKEDGVYPELEEQIPDIGFLAFSNLYGISPGSPNEARANRSRRFYARKLINVQFEESVGLNELTYEETDKYEHVYILDIRDQPPEGSVMVCKRMNIQLFALGTETRHYGGTYIPPAQIHGYIIIQTMSQVPFAPYTVKIRFRYIPAVTGEQPTQFRLVIKSGPSVVPDVIVPINDNHLYQFQFDGADTFPNEPYFMDLYGENGVVSEVLVENLGFLRKPD